MTTLIIAEKSSAGRDIANFLSKEHNLKLEDKKTHINLENKYVVAWASGHLLEYQDPHEYDENYAVWKMEDLPIIPQKFILRPVMKKQKEGHKIIISKDDRIEKLLNNLKKLISQAEIIINAGDAGREGQVIIDEILSYFNVRKNKVVKRMWIDGLNDAEIKKSMSRLFDNNEKEGLYLAGLMRSETDWLLGINLSRGVTLKFKEKKVNSSFSVGRVQTTVLKLIYDRYNDINNFVPKEYYDLNTQFINQNGNNVTANLVIDKDKMKNYIDEEDRIIDKKYIHEIKEELEKPINFAKVTEIKTVNKNENHPKMYSLSTLQQECNKELKIGVSQTLAIAQLLYEAKLITYPRTSSNHLPESQYAEAIPKLKMLKNFNEVKNIIPEEIYKSSVWDDSKLSDHHAIIPLEYNEKAYNSLSDEAKSIFKMIVKRYICHFYPPKKIIETLIEIDCKGYKFKKTEQDVISKGWSIVYDQKEKTESTVTKFKQNEELTINKNNDKFLINIETKMTTPPKYFTEGTLINAMTNISKYLPEANLTDKEKAMYKQILSTSQGIGTEATRAPMIENLKMRELIYIRPKSQNIDITEKGIDLISNLIEIGLSEICSPIITAQYENLLSKVEKKEMSVDDYKKQFIESLNSSIKILKSKDFTVSKGLYDVQTKKYEKFKAKGTKNQNNVKKKAGEKK